MDNEGRRKIDYIELIRAIAGHWKPVIQDKQFRRAMLKWIVGTIAFTAFMIFGLSLDSTGEELGKLMDEIVHPSGAVKMGGGGLRKGLEYTYKFPGMSDDEVRSYYKKELMKKKWKFEKKDINGSDVYSKFIYRNGYTDKYAFFVQRSKGGGKYDYDWILKIYKGTDIKTLR